MYMFLGLEHFCPFETPDRSAYTSAVLYGFGNETKHVTNDHAYSEFGCKCLRTTNFQNT